MLVLVAGATGNIGQHLIDSLTSRGHQVRALVRNPSKLPAAARAKLESIVRFENIHDVPVFERACAGVDAVVNAWNGAPQLQLEGQLLLLGAVERAGVGVYVAAGWSYDWRRVGLGQHESYDGFKAFHNQAQKTSSVRPNYIISGVLAEVFFSAPGHVDFGSRHGGCWDVGSGTMSVWGTGREPWHWTTERDAAEFAAAIIEREDASQGGFWSVCSGVNSVREIADVYARVRGCEVKIDERGSVDDLRRVALEARSKGTVRGFWEYIGWFYHLHVVDGTYVLGSLDNDKLDVKTTSLEDFLREYPAV